MNIPKRLAVLATTLTASLGLVVIPAADAAQRNWEVGVCFNGKAFAYGYANVAGYNQHNKYIRTPDFRLGKSCGYMPHWWYKPNQTLSIVARKQHESIGYEFFRNNFPSKCSRGHTNTSVRYCWVA
jgi:hypothetical protein